MWARFTVLNETPIASAIAGCVIPLSRSNTIWMRSRCAAGIFHRSAVFSSRICFLVHLTIRPPESDSQSESYPAPSRDPEKRQKSLDSNSYGSGIKPKPGCQSGRYVHSKRPDFSCHGYDSHGGLREAIRSGICRWIAFDVSAVLLVPVVDMAIMNPVGHATAIWRGIPDNRGIRVFDHELIAEDEVIPKHLRGISCQCRNSGHAGQHQRADDLHGASPCPEI